MIETNVKEDFLDLFYHEINGRQLEKGNKLNAFVLKIKNNGFAYDELVESLSNQLYKFALSRNEIKVLEKEKKYGTLISRAKAKLRHYTSNEGELGEILLYCLLESHLISPKILTKLELKTNSNDYVKGADGVHLLEVSNNEYQLILGESKLNADIKSGIYAAFDSLNKFIKDQSKATFEIALVNSQLVKEAFDEDLYNFLKKIIIPSAKEDSIYLDYSFGIFIGYEIEVTPKEMKLPNSEFRKVIRNKSKQAIEDVIESFNFQINKTEFDGYSFNIYLIPFTEIEMKRKEIIQQITQ